jgi:hypothetical protein
MYTAWELKFFSSIEKQCKNCFSTVIVACLDASDQARVSIDKRVNDNLPPYEPYDNLSDDRNEVKKNYHAVRHGAIRN